MARPEAETRLVLIARCDEDCRPDLGPGPCSGLFLGTWLAGSEVEIADVGAPLAQGERELGPFREALERRIGRVAERIGAEPMFGPRINAPKRGTHERDDHFRGHGELSGLCDAYFLLTGKPQATAVTIGLEAWKRHLASNAETSIR
jgi:hypothetical protein